MLATLKYSMANHITYISSVRTRNTSVRDSTAQNKNACHPSVSILLNPKQLKNEIT